ncbi:MAG: hypothetical protein AAF730_00725 [Bacteroidota bacterium]
MAALVLVVWSLGGVVLDAQAQRQQTERSNRGRTVERGKSSQKNARATQRRSSNRESSARQSRSSNSRQSSARQSRSPSRQPAARQSRPSSSRERTQSRSSSQSREVNRSTNQRSNTRSSTRSREVTRQANRNGNTRSTTRSREVTRQATRNGNSRSATRSREVQRENARNGNSRSATRSTDRTRTTNGTRTNGTRSGVRSGEATRGGSRGSTGVRGGTRSGGSTSLTAPHSQQPDFQRGSSRSNGTRSGVRTDRNRDRNTTVRGGRNGGGTRSTYTPRGSTGRGATGTYRQDRAGRVYVESGRRQRGHSPFERGRHRYRNNYVTFNYNYFYNYRYGSPSLYKRFKRARWYDYHYRKYPFYRPSSFININIVWPWQRRYRQRWRPRYTYRQTVYVEAGWGNRYRDAEVEVQTYYSQEVRRAGRNSAEVDIFIDQLDIFENGRFVGTVRDIPRELSRVRATVSRDGRVRLDRDIFIVGDSFSGFELISTRYYDGFVLDRYRRNDGYRVGEVDLFRERVFTKRRSELFRPNDFNGFVPISILPEDVDWLTDFGQGSVSAYYYGDDPDVFYGSYGDGDLSQPYYSQRDSQGQPLTAPSLQPRTSDPLQLTDDQQFNTENGATIRLRRDTQIQRIR